MFSICLCNYIENKLNIAFGFLGIMTNTSNMRSSQNKNQELVLNHFHMLKRLQISKLLFDSKPVFLYIFFLNILTNIFFCYTNEVFYQKIIKCNIKFFVWTHNNWLKKNCLETIKNLLREQERFHSKFRFSKSLQRY